MLQTFRYLVVLLTESQWGTMQRPSGPIGFRLSLTPRAPIRGSGSDDRVGSLLAFLLLRGTQ